MAATRNKIALGTVQFGLPYGLSNRRGQVPPAEVCEILAYGHQHQIDILDTAAAYGTSETVLGECLRTAAHAFKIISKLPAACKPEAVANQVRHSLQQLRVHNLYAYLFHDFDNYRQNPATLDELFKLKAAGLIQHIGFSLYYPHQLEYLWQHNISFDLVQLPFNILDQRFAYLFPLLQEKNIQVHVRSVFLQGLLLTPPDQLHSYFKPLVPVLEQVHQLAVSKNLAINYLCLGFAHLFPAINNLVIGVTSIADLKANINYLDYLEDVAAIWFELKNLAITEEAFLLPFNWKTN